MSSVDVDDTDLPEYFAAKAMKQPPQPEQIQPSVDLNTHQPEQKPVGYWMGKFSDGAATLYKVPQESFLGYTYQNIPVYTTPPQRKPLTDEQIQKCYETTGHYQTLRPQDRFAVFALARAIEAAHGIKE